MDSQGHTLCYGGVGWERACPPVIRRHRQRPLYVCLLSPECHAAVHTPQAHLSSPIPTLTGVTIILLIRSLQKNSSYLFSPHETLYVASAVKKPSSINNIGLSI